MQMFFSLWPFRIAFLFISIYIFYALTYDTSLHPWHALLLVDFEFALAYYVLGRMIRSALFFLTCTMLGTLVYTGHVKEVNRAVHRCLTPKSKKGPIGTISARFHSILHTQLREHNLVCYLVSGCGLNYRGGSLAKSGETVAENAAH